MSQLNDFSGGLSIRLAPHLISPNESVICENIEPSSNSLAPFSDDLDELQNFGANSGFVYFSGSWVARSGSTSYVEFQDNLYYADGSVIPQKTSNGTDFYNMGLTQPTTKLTCVYNGVLDPADKDTRQYCYTHYNAADGTESPPSSYSLEVEVSTNDVTIDTFSVSADSQVTHIRLYRLGGNLSNMTLVATLSNTLQQYNDTFSDLDIASNHQLDSFNAGQAPTGLAYLTEYNAMIFGAKGDKVYYSEVGRPNEWSAFSFIDFSLPITGLGATQNGLLVFTKSDTHLITGNSPAVLNKTLLHSSQGCINHHTIKYVDNILVWLSLDGLCTSNGSNVQVMSLDKLGKLSVVSVDAVIYDSQYFLFTSTKVYVVDFRYSAPEFRTISVAALGSYYSSLFDKIYYTDATGKLWSLGTGEGVRTYHYKTGKLTEGMITNLKNYRTIYIYIEGTTQTKVYTNKGLILTHNLVDGLNEVKIPQDKKLGYYIELEFTGTGIVREVEFKMEARTNGR